LSFTIWTIVGCCKAPLFGTAFAVTLVSPEVVYLCAVMSRQIESWFSDCGVIH